jgi:hypothetical protein
LADDDQNFRGDDDERICSQRPTACSRESRRHISFRETSTLACRVGLVDLLDQGYGACNNAGWRLTTRMALGRLIGWNSTTLRLSRCRPNFSSTVMIEVGAG